MKNVSDSRFQKRFMVVTGLGFVASTFFFSFQNFSQVEPEVMAPTEARQVVPVKPTVMAAHKNASNPN